MHSILISSRKNPHADQNVYLHVVSPAINGVIYNLKGLRMYTDELVCWHLINVGSPKDFQSVHFHGQTFIHKKITSYRQAVYPLLPGEHHQNCNAQSRHCPYTMPAPWQRLCVPKVMTFSRCVVRELCHSGDVPIQTRPVAAGDRSGSEPTEGHADPLSCPG